MTGPEIKTLRLKLGYSQDALAQRLGVCRRTVMRWEKGYYAPRSVSARMLKALAAGRLTEYGWVSEEKHD